MKTSDFDYYLPERLIAQTPIEPRDRSRMLVYDRANDVVQDRIFRDLPEFLRPGDVLVINDAGVIIRMAVSGISTYGRTAQGVKIMNLEEGVKVISFARTDQEEEEEDTGATEGEE